MDNDKKEVILNKAKELFAYYGFKKTTIDDIANAMNMGKSSLYYYFKNKDEVYKEVIENEIRELKSRILAGISKIDNPVDKIEAFITTRLNYLNEKFGFYSTIAEEFLTLYAFVEKIRGSFSMWEIQTIKSILDDGIKKGFFEIDNKDIVAEVLFYGLKGLELPAMKFSHIHKNIKQYLSILFHGILKR